MKPGIVLTSLITRWSLPSAAVAEEEVHPGEAPAVHGEVGPAGDLLHGRGLLGREIGRDVEVHRVVEVLRREVVPVDPGPQPDLGGQAGVGQAAAPRGEHAALDLPARDRRLHDHLRVDRGRRRHGLGELRPVGDLGDADARPGPGGLHEDREPQPFARRLVQDVGVRAHRAGGVAEHHVIALRQTGRREQLLGELLVHGRRAGEHPGPHVGQTGHLQQALDRPVLAVGAVQDGEDDVDLGQGRADRRRGIEDGEAAARRVADERHRRPAGDLGQRAVGDRQPLVRVGQHPAAVGRDADGHDLVAVGVQRGDHAPGRDAGDGVLRAAATEHDRDAHLVTHGGPRSGSSARP